MPALRDIDARSLATCIPRVVADLLDALRAAGPTWLVGGTVRDLFLGRPSMDYDVAVPLEPRRLHELVAALSGAFRSQTWDRELGVYNLIATSGEDVAVSSFRAEADYGPDRRPRRVWFGVDLEQDARRRDYTVNACYLGWPGAELVDPCSGRDDLAAGRLRVIGAARERLDEDPLRVLRGLRFAAGCGLEADAATDAALQAVAPRCIELVATRQFAELTGLWVDGGPGGLRLARECGVLDRLLPEFRRSDGAADAALAAVPRRAGARWAAVGLLASPVALDSALERLQAPRSVRREAVVLRQLVEQPLGDDPARLAGDLALPILESALPALVGQPRATRLLAVLRGVGGRPGTALVDAATLLAAGVPAGPALGAAIRRARLRLADGTDEPTPAHRRDAIRDAVAFFVKGDEPSGR